MEWQGVHGDYFQPGLTAHWNRLSSTPCIRGAWCGRTTDPGEVTWGIPPLITKQRPTNVEIETWDIMGIPWAMGIIHLQNYDATSSLFCKRWKETVASFEPPSKKMNFGEKMVSGWMVQQVRRNMLLSGKTWKIDIAIENGLFMDELPIDHDDFP